ncbi:MAG: hypothetical protein U0360_06745 [Dehalococcoidia bacterium]
MTSNVDPMHAVARPAQEAHGSTTWTPASSRADHPLARLEGVNVGDGVDLRVMLGPRNHVGSTYFRLHLAAHDLGGMIPDYLAFGLHNSGPYPGYNWIEVIEWRDVLALADGRAVEVPAGIELHVFERLGELVPPGGHMMAEYDSPPRVITARALAARSAGRDTARRAAHRGRVWHLVQGLVHLEGGREGRATAGIQGVQRGAFPSSPP